MASTEISKDQFETSLDMGPRVPKPRPRVHGGQGPCGHGVSKELTIDPMRTGVRRPVRTGYPKRDTMRNSSNVLVAFFPHKSNMLHASLWNISSYRIHCTWCSIGICQLIPTFIANISSHIWTLSLIPSNILDAASMDNPFKYISMKTLVHMDCH